MAGPPWSSRTAGWRCRAVREERASAEESAAAWRARWHDGESE
ncbi:hypothetical protein ACH495_19650 [Micromonospora sp. NPDC018662]